MPRQKRAGRHERLTVSVPADIAVYLRAESVRLGVPVSTYVADSLRARWDAELEESMIAGLTEDMAKEGAQREQASGSVGPGSLAEEEEA